MPERREAAILLPGKRITSRDNPFFKSLLKLAHSSRERKRSGIALLEGTHLVAAYLDHVGLPRTLAVSETGASNAEIAALLARCRSSHASVIRDALFAEASAVSVAVGILALVETPKVSQPASDLEFCLLLDGVQDPGNLGSILRSAAAAGASDVLLSKQCATVWSPRVLRAGMGAHFLVELHEHVDLLKFVEKYSGTIVAACARAERTIFETDLTGKIALLIGSEGAGIAEKLRAEAKVHAAIPMLGKTESLNVAAAAAICLFERVRQTSPVQ